MTGWTLTAAAREIAAGEVRDAGIVDYWQRTGENWTTWKVTVADLAWAEEMTDAPVDAGDLQELVREELRRLTE